MTDTKAILARADEALGLAENASPGPWRRDGQDYEPDECVQIFYGIADTLVPQHYLVAGAVDQPDAEFITRSRTLVPQLAADVRGLVAEVERLQIGTEWDLREQLASVLNSNAKWQKQDEKNGLKIIAWRQRAERAEADADALGKTALEQAERAKKAEARVKELEARDAERLRPGHACDFSADLTVMTTRAELAEARLAVAVKALRIEDCLAINNQAKTHTTAARVERKHEQG